MKKITLIFLLIFGCQMHLISQKGFAGSAVIGLTASQLDGDELVGYDKLGLSTGIKVSFDLTKKLAGNVEVLYSQRGSSEKLFKRAAELDITKLNYFELPFYLSFGDWYNEKGQYYRMRGHFGFSYAALVSSSGQSELYSFADLGKNDFSYLLGASYSFSSHWTFTVRFTRALNKLLKDETLDVGYLLSYFWTFRTDYTF